MLEGLKTSGSSDSVESGQTKQTLRRRKNFASPNPGCAHILTMATSDGADDDPGTPKESVIGNLSQSEGVQVLLVKVSQNFSDKLDGFVRYGSLSSSAKNMTTDSSNMGYEIDVNASYKLAPDTLLSFDYAYFKPGAYFPKSTTCRVDGNAHEVHLLKKNSHQAFCRASQV